MDATKGKKNVWQSQPDAPMPEAFGKLVDLDPMLKSIWEEANHPRYRLNPNFCRNQLWGATPRQSGKFGLKALLSQRVGSGAAVEALRTGEAWDIACAVIREAIPPCNHAPGAYHKDGDVEWQDDTCTHQYPLEVSQRVEGRKAISTDRNANKGFKSLTAMLEESAGGEPAKNLVIKSFDDKNEPTFLIRSFAHADALWNRFRFEERMNAGEISPWYANHALYIIGEDESKLVVEADLSPKDLAHYSWRPMVQCFKDDAFTATLLKLGVPVTVVLKEMPETIAALRPMLKPSVNGTAEGTLVILDRLVKEKTKSIDWLWREVIPQHKVTVFGGNPGVGKSIVSLDLAARISAGLDFPDGSPNTHGPMEVMLLFCEDDAADTVVPRLKAAGANMENLLRIRVQEPGKDKPRDRQFALDTDLPLLDKALALHPETGLVIIDPISSYIGETDMNKEQKIRMVLTPLVEMVEKRGVTVILVAHFSKRADVSALHKVSGAVAMTGVSRATWLFAADAEAENNNSYLMLQGKINIAEKIGGFKYGIEAKPLLLDDGNTENVPFIQWRGKTEVTADQALGSIAAFGDGEGGKLGTTGQWLQQFLNSGADGRRQAKEVYDAAKKAGVSERTLQRAKAALGVKTTKIIGVWFWFLPADGAQGATAGAGASAYGDVDGSDVDSPF